MMYNKNNVSNVLSNIARTNYTIGNFKYYENSCM